jgi:hypothetical protein
MSPNREDPMTLLEFIVSRHADDNPRGASNVSGQSK